MATGSAVKSTLKTTINAIELEENFTAGIGEFAATLGSVDNESKLLDLLQSISAEIVDSRGLGI